MRNPRTLRRVVVALDLAEPSKRALATARWLSVQLRARLMALYVVDGARPGAHWQDPIFDGACGQGPASDDLALEQALRRRLEALGGAVGDMDVEVRRGPVAETIVAAAAELDAALIVLGTHGRKGRIGSVAEHVVRDAGRSVLVCPVDGGEPVDVKPRPVATQQADRV